jgi:hypothetical protein
MRRLLFLIAFFAAPIFAADPPPPDASPPAIVELSPLAAPPAPPTPPPDTPYALSAERFRWWVVRGYAGNITWEVEPAGIIGLSEITKATTLFGKVEGGLKPDFYDLPVGAVVTWPAADQGTAKLSALGVVNGKAQRLASIKIQVGPPGPAPPPVPPPTPTDPLFLSLQAAYNVESAADRVKVPLLAAIYRAAAKTTVHDKALTTNTALAAELTRAVQIAVGGPSTVVLPKLRRAIGDELNAKLPRTPDLILDDAARTLWEQEFNLIASRLEVLK